MTIINLLARRHVSAKYSHHQANIEARFRYIKYALNGILLCLQYWSNYSYNKNSSCELNDLQSTSSYLRMPCGW